MGGSGIIHCLLLLVVTILKVTQLGGRTSTVRMLIGVY